MADVIELPVNKFFTECERVTNYISENNVKTFIFIAISEDNKVFSVNACDEDVYAMLGAIEVTKRDIMNEFVD